MIAYSLVAQGLLTLTVSSVGSLVGWLAGGLAAITTGEVDPTPR